MKPTIGKEIILIVLACLPVFVVAFYWNELPQEVPTHFNIQGEADDWTDKRYVPYLFGGISLFLYLALLLAPKIDPKKQIAKMGNKYFIIRLITTTLVSLVLSLSLLATVQGDFSINDYWPYALIVFFIVFGNYMQSLKPNYFVGIRTPWTLESEDNWRKTHRFGGRVAMAGGALLLVVAPFLPNEYLLTTVIIGVLLIALIPGAYSFIIYLKDKKD